MFSVLRSARCSIGFFFGSCLHRNNAFFAGDLKRICETDLGLVSQCCLTKHVYKMSKQYLANVSLKINVKVDTAILQICDPSQQFHLLSIG